VLVHIQAVILSLCTIDSFLFSLQ